MKKIITLIVLILIANIATAQDPGMTNEQIIEYLQRGGELANLIRPQNWVPGVNNNLIISAVTFIGTAILGLFHRKRTTKRWKKQGKLSD